MKPVYRMNPVYRVLLLTISLSLGGCGWLSKDEVDPTADWSAGQFYSAGKEELRGGNYRTAIEYFEQLQARYPFGRYAQQAQLEIAYAHYKAGETDQAVAAADRFIRTYPRNPFVDYAYYVKGLAHYSRGGILERVMPSDRTRTDPASALQAFSDFSELVERYPDSRYAEDARQRMLFLRNNLAEYEVNVGRFYLNRHAYVAAVNRGTFVLENFETTPAVEDALGLMGEAYVLMGLDELARDSYRVLTLNYPDSPYVVRLDLLFDGQPVEPIEESQSLVTQTWDLFVW